MHTSELTLPGFLHDECSAIHPMGILSPFLRQLDLERHGLQWVRFPVSVAHPLDDGPAVLLSRSVDETAERMGPDAARWRRLVEPFLAHPHDLLADVMGPLSPRVRRPCRRPASDSWACARRAPWRRDASLASAPARPSRDAPGTPSCPSSSPAPRPSACSSR